tara:strand:- start:338 stop:607 length:270 start_codon:yes stop_codon:yes gene_type:complete
MNKSYTKELALLGAFALIPLIVSLQTNTSMQVNAGEVPKVEEETFYVIDASYIDHSGKYDDCVEYADSYKDHHDYVVVTAKNLKRNTPE